MTQFQVNIYDAIQKKAELSPNITICESDVFSNPRATFAQCVSSDPAMSAGIATQFVRIFPGSSEVRKTHFNLTTGSLIAFFNASSNNWMYNLVTKPHSFDKPTHFDVNKCLCCMKSDMLQNNINVVHLPQIGCELDKSYDETGNKF